MKQLELLLVLFSVLMKTASAGRQHKRHAKITDTALTSFPWSTGVPEGVATRIMTTRINGKRRRRFPLLLVTFIFGPDRFEELSFPFFVKSAGGCGASVLIIGDTPLPSAVLPLPDNIWHHQITWDFLVARAENVYAKPMAFDLLRRQVSRSQDGQGHARGRYFKVVDFKPLVAILFPELLRGWDWWGYIDNDMWLGNLRTHVLPQLMSGEADFYGKDVDPGRKNGPAYGPFTMQRNNQNMTLLMNSSNTRRIVRLVLKTPHPVCFSEWGKEDWGGLGYESSYSGIVMAAVRAGHIRLGHIRQAFLWDMPCHRNENASFSAAITAKCMDPAVELQSEHKLCLMSMQDDGNTSLLMRDCDGLWAPCFYCHFEYGKSQPALKNLSIADQVILLQQSTISRSYHCGIF